MYDYLGRRVSKSAGGTSYVYPAPSYEILNLPDGGQQRTIYLYAGRDLVAASTMGAPDSTGATVYYMTPPSTICPLNVTT